MAYDTDVFVVAVRVVGLLRRAAAIAMPFPPEVPRRRRRSPVLRPG